MVSKREAQRIPRLCNWITDDSQIQQHAKHWKLRQEQTRKQDWNGKLETDSASRTILEKFLCLDSRIQIY